LAVLQSAAIGDHLLKGGDCMNIRKSRLAYAALAGIVAAGVGVGQVQATPSTVTSTVLAQSVIKPIAVWGHGKTAAGRPWAALLATYGMTDGYVVDNKFGRGQSTGWHMHPGPSLIFVVKGTVTNYESGVRDCEGKSYSAGSTLVDAGGTDVHMLRNNGRVPAETIAVQFIPSGQPRRVDVVTEPANCHE
jgi:hypothetical protein